MEWMMHRKWKETKQQPGTAGPGNILGCCLVSLHFLCDIHSIHPVVAGAVHDRGLVALAADAVSQYPRWHLGEHAVVEVMSDG